MSTAKKVAIVQSNYIPWKGYFDIINSVDEFILFDDMQYTRRDWRNRNRIKTQKGVEWLTIPIEVKGRYHQKIRETLIADPEWAKKHWATIVHNYSKAACFKDYKDFFEGLYLGGTEKYLSGANYRFIKAVCDMLGVKTQITWSMDYTVVGGKTKRLTSLCTQAHATQYISGPSAKSYIDEELFKKEGITLAYMDYSGYPEYRQLFPPFDHFVSVVDLILNEGLDAKKYMKSFGA